MQLAHQVVALQHTTHIQGQSQGYGHRQTLGHGHDDKRYGHHKIFQHHSGHAYIVGGVPQGVDKDVVRKEDNEGGNADAGAHNADELGQTGELKVQRRLHSSKLGGLAGYLAYLGGVAHSLDTSRGAAAHHHGRTQDEVGRIGGLGIGGMAVVYHMLVGHRLARERTLVYLQSGALYQASIGRYLVARLNNDEVAHHHLTARHLKGLALAYHLYGLLFAQGGKTMKLAGGVHLKHEAYGGGQDDGQNDANGLDIFAIDDGQAQRHQRRYKQYLDDGVVIFFDVKFP